MLSCNVVVGMMAERSSTLVMARGRDFQMTIRFAVLYLATVLANLTAWADEDPSRLLAEHPAMGTMCRIVVYGQPATDSSAAFEVAFHVIDDLESLLSDYRPTSEISQLPARSMANGTPQFVPVDPRTHEVLEAAQALAQETRGAFDCTAGSITHLWREARRLQIPPNPVHIADGRNHVGWQRLQVSPSDRAVKCHDKEMVLDLGGIAKGYAAREALRALQSRGIESAVVSVGGDVALGRMPAALSGGTHAPKTPGFRVQIAPDGRGTRPLATIRLSKCGVSTSGVAEQGWEHGGHSYSHIVDPRTGQALEGSYSVTVIAADSLQSDGMATALSVMGPVEGLAWLAREHPEVDALFVRPSSEWEAGERGEVGEQAEASDGPRFWMTPGMAARLREAEEIDATLAAVL